LLEGDKKEDRVIVYCTNNKSGICYGGNYVIPTYARHYDSAGNNYAEYIETATSNKEWIIAKSFRIKEKQEYYWIINKDFDIKNLDCTKVNCDSIIQSYVTGPLSLTEFKSKMEAFNIELDFK
jgi:hypothetical protein